MRRPAILGSAPAFPEGVPFARPLTSPLDAVVARLQPSYDKGILTNGPLVAALEEQAAERLGAPHVVAVSSCTAGLMLAVQALSGSGSVLLPSFTFSASAHAIVWNGGRPLFTECDPSTFQLDMVHAEKLLPEADAILATHVFGAPCPATAVEEVGRARGLPTIFDAAHAFGALHDGRPIGGFGDAEVFSLSPTKPVVAGEGGLVATRHADLATQLRVGRDYGNPGDYDTRFVGLNARLSELHAAVALESLQLLDEHLERRSAVAERYRKGIAGLPGIQTQEIGPGDTSTYKDFTVSVDPTDFGLSRDLLGLALKAEGVETRKYFDPPVHRQQSYAAHYRPLPTTDVVSSRVISLPMFGTLELETVDQVAECLHLVHDHAEEISEGAFRSNGPGAVRTRQRR